MPLLKDGKPIDDPWQPVAVGETLPADGPVVVPFALATVIGGIDCTESAAAAGDEYDTRAILLTEGFATLAAGLCGGVVESQAVAGHPAEEHFVGRLAHLFPRPSVHVIRAKFRIHPLDAGP